MVKDELEVLGIDSDKTQANYEKVQVFVLQCQKCGRRGDKKHVMSQSEAAGNMRRYEGKEIKCPYCKQRTPYVLVLRGEKK